MTHLNQLADEIHANAVEHGFIEAGLKRDIGLHVALIHSEVSEMFEEHRSGYAVDETYFREDGKPEGIPAEAADIIIRVLDFCAENRIDINEAIELKMRFNKSRPYKHGKVV